MKPFKRRKRGGVYGVFEASEAHLIVNLLGQVVELLRDRNAEDESSPDPLFAQIGIAGSHLPPEDPVLQRLLPDGYSEDEEASADFRRYTERDLSTSKVDNAKAVIASLQQAGLDLDELEASSHQLEVELDDDAVQAWLKSLTDVRLSLAVRLGIGSDDDEGEPAPGPEGDEEAVAVMADVYDWLGYVQETLVLAL